MKKELQEKLIKDFPTLFADRDKSPRETCMCYGCDCASGWEPIIREACEKLTALNEPKLKFTQVKEKFGSLRLYTSLHNEEIGKIVRDAENKSCETCEECRTTDNVTTKGPGWILTLCEKCRKERFEKRNKNI